ncbi:phage tail protein [Amycolatopsis japonica]
MPAGRDKVTQAPATPPARPVKPARRATPPALLRLQAAAGNAAVTRLVGLQRSSCPAPPVAPAGVTPASDPKFGSLKKDVSGQAKAAKAHPPASAEVKKAQDAAVAPADDKEAQAKAAQADKMAAAKPAGFDKAAFVAAVNAAVAKQAPQNLDEADKFASSGKADQIKSEVMGKVTSGKDASAKDVTERTKEAPDTSRATEKPVKPLPETPPPPALSPPDARKATPDKAPPAQTDLRADQCETHGKMAEAGVTDQQLAQSNEPEFTGALAAKQEGEQHTASAPAAVRESEAGRLAAVTGAAQASGQAAMAGMTGARSSSGQRGQAAKSATKAKDEQDRARITAEIKAIFEETKTKVEGLLGALDEQVAKRFETGEAAAKAAFTADHQARMKKYKDERYDGVTGAARWSYDLFAGLPAEANNLFLEAKKVYESKMQGVIGEIADFVGQQLTEAKRLIAEGRERVRQKVDSQSPALRKIAGEAAKEFGGQFDELENSVDEKQQSLVEDLAQKYSEARNAVDEEIKALQAENKGLWDKAKEAIGGAIDTILKLKDMLLSVLARAANAVGLIIAKPIEFLGNLVNAVKTGVMNFGANIVQHLKDGLKAWLLGNLASAGIEIPETLDAKGILKMIMSLLGLTWASVRARILRFIPEPVLAKLEQTFEVVKILITEGVPGLWRWVIEKLGDLKELVLGQIKEFVIEKIVKAGITWIISMLNPAAAFIKACKAIYDIVMFFVDKAAQIKEFVSSVLDSVESIARGGAGAVAGLIERTLAKALPMVLGFLASLLGLGGISEKIKSILEKVQAPVGKVIDTVVGTIVKAGKKIWSKVKGAGRDLKDKIVKLLRPEQDSLNMNGDGHTLIATPTPDGGVVEMASTRGKVSTKAKKAIADFTKKNITPKPGQIDALNEIVASAEAVEKLVKQAGKEGKAKTLLEYNGFPGAFRSLKSLIVAYARKYKATDITAEVLEGERLKLAGEVGADLQTMAHAVRDHLVATPVDVDAVLTAAERKILERKPFLWRANFGKAMERVMAARIAASPKLRKYLTHVGTAGTPDWTGKDIIKGAKYDVTTDNEATIKKHEGRWWWDKKVDILIKYTAPPEPK